mmetsp:Transcript_17774/g.51902  ORF Transcript_17774/g.51902 Transcript_17774/m.51902 type:complete len:201 (-) Transcript_17774:369-971(-)
MCNMNRTEEDFRELIISTALNSEAHVEVALGTSTEERVEPRPREEWPEAHIHVHDDRVLLLVHDSRAAFDSTSVPDEDGFAIIPLHNGWHTDLFIIPQHANTLEAVEDGRVRMRAAAKRLEKLHGLGGCLERCQRLLGLFTESKVEDSIECGAVRVAKHGRSLERKTPMYDKNWRHGTAFRHRDSRLRESDKLAEIVDES